MAKTSNAQEPSTPRVNREAWLTEVAQAMVPWFTDLGFPVPDFRISTGFPKSGGRGWTTAEAWREDGVQYFTIVVRPDQTDPLVIAASLAQQLALLAAGSKDRHGYLFRHLATSLGLRGRRAASPAGLVFKQLVAPVLEQVGPIPATSPGHGAAPAEKQSSRLIKVSCDQCGYVARVSRKWLDEVGPPHCPDHGPMRETS